MKLKIILFLTGSFLISSLFTSIICFKLRKDSPEKTLSLFTILTVLCSREDLCPILFDNTTTTLPEILEKIHLHPTVPPIIWSFWFSSEQKMGPLREQGINTMATRFGVPVIFLTEKTIQPFLQWSIHPALQYASKMHMADYFRIYFCYHYGGGYADLKLYMEGTQKWTPFFQELEDAQEADVLGVPEIGPYGVASPPNQSLGEFHYRLISNGFFIAKRNNDYFYKVHQRQNDLLTNLTAELIKHPAPYDRCCRDHEQGYPIDWSGLLGQIMSSVGVTIEPWEKRILRKLTYPPYGNYVDEK